MDITDFKINNSGQDEKIASGLGSIKKDRARFSMQGRGESMMRLTQEVIKWKNNTALKILTVDQFYYFYQFLKETMPVMNILSKKYEEKENADKPKLHDVLAKMSNDMDFSFREKIELNRFPKMNKRKSDEAYSCFNLPGKQNKIHQSDLEPVQENFDEEMRSNS